MNFDTFKVNQLRFLIWAIRQCNPKNNEEFSGYIREVINYGPLDLKIGEIAAHLLVNRLTLQRWSKGLSLPYPTPRLAYINVLTSLLEDHYKTLTGESFLADDEGLEIATDRSAQPLDICTM